MRDRKDKPYQSCASIDLHRRNLTTMQITALVAGKVQNIDLSENFLMDVNCLSNLRFLRLRSLNLCTYLFISQQYDPQYQWLQLRAFSSPGKTLFMYLKKYSYGNQIQDLAALGKIHAPLLSQLKLGYRNGGNKIKDKNIQTLMSQLNAPQLSQLTLDYNEISQVSFLKCWKFQKLSLLYISGNKIETIDPYCLMELTNIKILSFKNNYLTNLKFMAKLTLPFLSYLNISDNFILTSQAIQQAEFKSLIKLSLSRNLINHFANILKCNWAQASEIQISELCSPSQKKILKQIRKKYQMIQ